MIYFFLGIVIITIKKSYSFFYVHLYSATLLKIFILSKAFLLSFRVFWV